MEDSLCADILCQNQQHNFLNTVLKELVQSFSVNINEHYPLKYPVKRRENGHYQCMKSQQVLQIAEALREIHALNESVCD